VKKLSKFQAIIGVFLLTASMQAQAVPLTGQIFLGGAFSAVDASWNPLLDLSTATGIDFLPPGGAPSNPFVSGATGDFEELAIFGWDFLGSTVTDFQFDPKLGINDGLNNTVQVASIQDFWSVSNIFGTNTYAFELTSVTILDRSANFLSLSGTGIITRNGMDATVGDLTFTGDGFDGFFNWNSENIAQGVPAPEPGIVLLLGMGILGFVASARMRK